MHQLITYLLGLVLLLLSTHITSSIEQRSVSILSSPTVDLMAEIPDILRLKTMRAKKNDKNRKILQCATRGRDINIKWTFNGTEVKQTEPKSSSKYELEKDNSRLFINHVTPSDSGAYRCYASNTYGMIFEEIRLSITGIGKFEEGSMQDDWPVTHNVTIGKPYELKCPPHSHLPGQIYTWAVQPLDFWKTGYPVKRVFQSVTHGSLYFSSVTKDDIERIQRRDGLACILYNDYSAMVVSNQIFLRSDNKEYTEDIAPKMVVPLKSEMTAVEGKTKKITCGATGKPHPKFEWWKDDEKITTSDPTTSTVKNIHFEGKGINLVMDPVDSTDNGHYKCVASNSEGKVETEGTMIVHSKPKFQKRLNRKNFIPVGEPISFECAAEGFPQPKYIWYHNNSVITTSARRVINGGKLSISASDYQDCGMYLCTAENMLQTIVSPAYVKIQDVAPEITKPLEKQYDILYATDKTLVCEATGGPKPVITWYRDGAPVVNGDNIDVEGGVLKITSAVKDLNGDYKCVAKNRKDEATTSTKINVYYVPPKFTEGPKNETFYQLYGTSVTIPCKASGVPTPKVTWVKGGVAMVAGQWSDKVTVTDDGSTLKFTEVTKKESGEYKCIASNLATTVWSTASVKVYSRTKITQGPADVKYRAGESAFLFCKSEVDKDLTTTRQWYKDGVLVPKNDERVFLKDSKRVDKSVPMSHTLQVDDLSSGDGGVYKCKVTSKDDATFISEAEEDGSITVIMAPLPAANLKISGSFDKSPKKVDDGSSTKTTGTGGNSTPKPSGGSGTSGGPPPGGPSSSPAPKTGADSEDVILSWDKPNAYVGPAEEYIIEYAPAGTPKDSDEWKRYDNPNKYKDTQVKLEEDKLPASVDVVFRVKAVTNDNGDEKVGEPSEPTKAGSLKMPSRAPKTKPSNVKLDMKDDGNDNVTVVTWDKLDDTDKPGPGFEVEVSYREKGSDGPFIKTSSNDEDGDDSAAGAERATGPPVSESGEDKEYEVKVKAKNEAGDGPEEIYFLTVPGKKPSGQPTNVKLVSRKKTEVTITWNGVAGATEYRIFYTAKTPSGRRRRNSDVQYVDSTGTEATIKSLKKGTKYDFTVAAKNGFRVGTASDPLTVDTANGVPETPKDVDVTPYADKVRVSWPEPETPEDVDNYTVTWYPKDDPSKKKTKTVPGGADAKPEAIIDDKLEPDTYYTVELTPNNKEGSGDPSVTEGVVVGQPDIPGQPGTPTATPLSDSDIKVEYNLPEGKTRGGLPDKVDICYTANTVCYTLSYPNKTSAVFKDLEPGKPYQFYTVASNAKGKSVRSPTVTMTTLDPPTTTASTTSNDTAIVDTDKSAIFNDDKAFYEELWFIILLLILIILIIIAIVLCIICNRRGGRYPVGEKEKKLGGWDREALKEYDDDADSTLENGVGVPLVPPNRSPDSLKKVPFEDDDEDSLADYGEGYGEMDQYGSEKKNSNGQTMC